GNGTCDATTMHDYHYPLYTAMFSLVLILGLPLNGISIWFLLRRLRQPTAPLVYMVNLALSDLLFLLSLPLRIYYFAQASWNLYNIFCAIAGTLFSVNIYSSTSLITLISLDCYLAIVYPLRSQWLRIPMAAKMACGMVWLLILAISIPIRLLLTPSKGKCNITYCFENHTMQTWKYAFTLLIVTTFVYYLLPFALIVFCTGAVVKKLASYKSERCPIDKRKVILLFISNLLVYSLCFLPFCIVLILCSLQRAGMGSAILETLSPMLVTLCLSSANSCLDPIIYYFAMDTISRIKGYFNYILTQLKRSKAWDHNSTMAMSTEETVPAIEEE
uniref:G-protein coupled receptors family 1 profile domain-containing protein n=1 Tax=Latimeria chalumnae TaxID=7897 RepID=H3ANF4_LATCH